MLKAKEEPQIEYVPSRFNIYKFTDEIGAFKMVFHILKMSESVFIIINDKDNLQMFDLSMALQSRYENLPIGTRIIGSFMEEHSKGLACKLTKKLNKTVFISCNIELDQRLSCLMEERLLREFKKNPQLGK